MAKKEEKLCPFLKVSCIKNKCAMWNPIYEDVDIGIQMKDDTRVTAMRYTIDNGYCGFKRR